MHKKQKAMFALAMQGWRGRQPPSRKTMSSWGRVRRPPPRPKDLVTTELFLGRRGAGEVVCRAPTQLNYLNMENHCVVSKLHSDFVLFCLLKVRTTTFDYNFTIMHIKPLRTGTAPPLVNGRRHEILRRQAVCGRASGWQCFFLQGLRPCTPASRVRT